MDPQTIIQICSAAGIGSILTALINKITNLRRDKQQLKASQQEYLEGINLQLNAVIERLQRISCYAQNCNHRVNAPDLDSDDHQLHNPTH